MPKVSKSKLYPIVQHALFGSNGILLDRRQTESNNDLCTCLFDDGTCLREILTSALLVFADIRSASLTERKAISRWLLNRSFKSKVSEPEPDDRPDCTQMGRTQTDEELEPEQEQESA
jgi:hypothetical protein